MKNKVLFILPLLFLACGSKTEYRVSEDEAQEPSQQQQTAYFELHEDRVNSVISVDVPAECSWRQSVGEWLDECMGGCYDGDPKDIQALVDFYGKSKADTFRVALEDASPIAEVEYEATATKAFETDRIVTYTLETYIGLGGAHPVNFSQGATFRKSDGRRLDWNIVRKMALVELNEIIKKSLMGYVGTDDEEKLTEYIYVEDPNDIPLTKNPPFFLDNGLVFVYQQYEIAAYAMGMPTDTIPYDKIKPLLTHTVQQLIP